MTPILDFCYYYLPIMLVVAVDLSEYVHTVTHKALLLAERCVHRETAEGARTSDVTLPIDKQ